MTDPAGSPELSAITALFGREIRRPIGSLRANLARILDDPDHPPTDAERAHVATMLGICEDLDRLTVEALGDGGPG